MVEYVRYYIDLFEGTDIVIGVNIFHTVASGKVLYVNILFTEDSGNLLCANIYFSLVDNVFGVNTFTYVTFLKVLGDIRYKFEAIYKVLDANKQGCVVLKSC